MEKSNTDPYNYCRTCMGFLIKTRNICDGKEDNNSLLKILHSILGFEINEESFKICERCENRLNSILEFKDLCLKTIQEFANVLCARAKEEPVDNATENYAFNFELKHAHIENDSLDRELELENNQITTHVLETRLNNSGSDPWIDSNSGSSNILIGNNYEPRYLDEQVNLDVHQSIEKTTNIEPVSTKHFRLLQFPKSDVLHEIYRYRNLLNTIKNRTCTMCNYVGKNVKGLSCHMSTTHRNIAKLWCNQCNLVTDNLLKHRNTSKCLDFFCIFCNDFSGHVKRSTDHLRSHSHEIHSSDESDQEYLFGEKCYAKSKTKQHVTESCFIKSEPQDTSLERDSLIPSMIENDLLGAEEDLLEMEPTSFKAEQITSNPLQLQDTSKNETKLQRSKRELHSKLCPICGKTVRKRSDLPKHMRTHGVTLYQCSHCDKQFTHKMYLVEHERRHTGEKPFHCSVCGKAFITSSECHRHERTHEGGPQQCLICNIACSRPERLRIHMKSHTGENKFSCDQCNKSFHIKSLLSKHIRTHSDARPFKCNYCDRDFKDKDAVTLHERTHTGNKMYRCTFCSFIGLKASYLTVHMKKHPEDAPQANNPHKCEICLKSFSTNANLLSHMNNQHQNSPDTV